MNDEIHHKKINILIDTCSWVDLLSEDINKLLPHLEFWNNNDCINIITHKVILDEWDEHKQKQKQRFSESLKTKYKHATEIARKENLSILQNLEPNIQNIDTQIQIIDNLLKKGTILDTSDDIKIKCSDRSISKKAPYHNKQDSTKDAYIIFSALKHFDETRQELLFISANKNDFGAPKNLETEIHPEIIEDYQNVKIFYYNDIGKAINVLKKELPITLIPEKVSSENSTSIDNSIEIDKTKHILDQVYDYISFIHSEVNFYPITLLINHFPFRTNKKSYSLYSIFSLNIDNKDMFELFSSIKITEDDELNIINTHSFEFVDNYFNKIKFIINALSQNLIFNITTKNARNSVRVRINEKIEHDCPLCNFKVFKFVECFNNINSFSNSKNDLRKSYYLYYLLGDYETAIEKQKELFNLQDRKQEKTQCFISQFNLSKLSRFLWHYSGEDSIKEIKEELQKIDIKRESIEFSTRENQKLLNYIRENTFFLNAKDKIQISTNKLRDQYYNSLNGGYSSNSEVGHLICEFAIIETFLSNNCIVFNKFSEFNELFAIFTEGIFVSYATKNEGNSRIDEFDDWLIHCLLIYGDSKIINKFHKRYKLEKINYKKTSQGESFVDFINNFFSNNNLRERYIDIFKGNNRNFWDYYDKIFRNILTLVSICNFEKNYIQEFTKKLIDYIGKNNFPHDFVDYFNIFLYRCGNELDNVILQTLFDLAIDNPLFHKSNYFEAFYHVINHNNGHLSINDERLDKVMNFVFKECSFCKEKHSENVIIQIFLLIDNHDFKNKISSFFIQKLKEQFDFNLFYSATLFDVIPFNEDLFSTALVSSYSKEPRLTYKSLFFDVRENRYKKIDEILNLCFKLDIATNTDDFLPIKALDKYYEWLVDMDNFDYDYFEPQWISEYSTRFYYKKFFYCKMIKKELNKIIKEKFEEQIERDYINIYIRKTWTKNANT